MTIDIEQLRTLVAKATPGLRSLGKPYTDDEGYREFPLFASVNGTTVCPVAVCLPFPHVSGMQEANAAFIMAARAALPALLDEVERLRAALDARPCSCPSGDGSLRHPCAVHPPAPLVDESPNLQGSQVDGSRDLQGQVDGGQQRAGDALPDYIRDLRYHVQYRIGWNHCVDAYRAALSATSPNKDGGANG
ncbi:hypothetical protein [Achromobacter xylosoxidans]|uniref:Uncharacterized protein n=1 Tax=Alcaligenes xylosoxydans xylosoxydans TaxID=85698 RepID=A0A0X8P523_ALCXX|nr:hypothetical protein [Achromobacter xylosoxidans]AMG39954.1 hypothetical protein AL504_30570 [Achromobacter xylosoxidans]